MKLSQVFSATVTLEPKGDLGASWVTRSSETRAGVPRRSEAMFHQVFRSSLLKPSLPSSVKASMFFWRSQMLNCHQMPVKSVEPKMVPLPLAPTSLSQALYSS
ncbi:hypothetical protein D9M72_400960 [compost metagenome]